MAKREEKRSANRLRILDAATELFFENGFAGTTMDMICESLGATKPFVYWYFADKSEILDTLSLAAAKVTLSSLREYVKGPAPIEERLRAGLRDFTRNHIRQFKAGTFYYREGGAHSPEARERIRSMAAQFHKDLVSLIEKGIEARVLPPQDAKITALAIGGIVGFMHTWYKADGQLPPEAIADRLTETMLRTAGLSRGEAKARPRSVRMARA